LARITFVVTQKKFVVLYNLGSMEKIVARLMLTIIECTYNWEYKLIVII
jgi:hypothetical protein